MTMHTHIHTHTHTRTHAPQSTLLNLVIRTPRCPSLLTLLSPVAKNRNQYSCCLRVRKNNRGLVYSKNGFILFRPPSVFYDPQIQIICCYIAHYYVIKWHVRLGVMKNLCSLSWGGGQNRIDPKKNLVRKKTTFEVCTSNS